MGHRLKLDVENYNEIALEIKDSTAFVEEDFHQCWCIQLKIWWQTLSIEGYAFLSSRWGEVIFQKVPDGQPPHFLSGKPIETDFSNDLLCEFAESISANPRDIANAIFKTLEKVVFVFSPLRLMGRGYEMGTATEYRYNNLNYKILPGDNK